MRGACSASIAKISELDLIDPFAGGDADCILVERMART